MTEKDPLQMIQDGLNHPLENLKPTDLDSAAIEKAFNSHHIQITYPPYYLTRNSKLKNKSTEFANLSSTKLHD